MTNYREEQSYEIEALQSIYESELTILKTEPYHVFVFDISAQDNGTVDNPQSTYSVSCQLQFTYTPTYPDEIPLMEIIDSENLDTNHTDELYKIMLQQAEDNIGMAMVFAIVSAVQEWLTDLTEQMLQADILEKHQKKQRDAEEEFARFQGTIVTIETFLAWKAKFDAEMEETKRLQGIQKQTTTKLTGRELFLKDSTMDDSDIQFFQHEGDSVEVDESLFQDLDDLDLDNDLDDSLVETDDFGQLDNR